MLNSFVVFPLLLFVFFRGGTTIITEKCPTLIEKGVVIFYDAVIKIPSVNSATKHYIGRYVIATTGNINDKAKEMINKARLKDHDRRIKYWDGEQLVEYIREYWLTEFINYFGIDAPSKKEPFQSSAVIDSDYMIENYGKLVKKIDKMRKSLNSAEFEILTVVAYICSSGDIHAAADADIFIELGHPEEYYRDENESDVQQIFNDII